MINLSVTLEVFTSSTSLCKFLLKMDSWRDEKLKLNLTQNHEKKQFLKYKVNLGTMFNKT